MKEYNIELDRHHYRQIIKVRSTKSPFDNNNYCRLCGLIVRVRVVPRRTVVGDIDRRFDNLSGSHHQIHNYCIIIIIKLLIVANKLSIIVWHPSKINDL